MTILLCFCAFIIQNSKTKDKCTDKLKKQQGHKASVAFFVDASESKPNTPSWDAETSLHLLPRFLAARPSGLVEMRGIRTMTHAKVYFLQTVLCVRRSHLRCEGVQFLIFN